MPLLPNALSAYKNRFRTSLADYLAWLDDPAGWKPRLSPRRSRSTNTDTKAASQTSSAPDTSGPETTGSKAVEPSVVSERLIDFPFPLRDGVIGVLSLPSDLTQEEAARLGAFVKALAFPGEEKASS